MVGSSASTHRIKELKWVRHNGIAYFLQESQRVHFNLAEQTGSWHSINSKYNDRPLTKEVFKLWIDHVNAPIKEKYAYILVPGITDNETAKLYPIENLKIIANNSMHQAVCHAILDIYQIIFYSTGQVNYKDFSVSVNIPSVLQLEQNNNVSIADPVQKYTKAEVTITCKNKTYAKTVQLPSGGNASATRTLTLETTNFK